MNTYNSYLSTALAREHQATLLADAAATRDAHSARTVRKARRAARTAGHHSGSGAARTLGRPFAALHSWYVAGEL